MQGVLELKRYGYKDVVLPTSKVKFSGKVNIKGEKVDSTEGNVSCKWEDKTFSFALNQGVNRPEMPTTEEAIEWTEPTASINNWPIGLSVDETIKEFKTFVLNDIA